MMMLSRFAVAALFVPAVAFAQGPRTPESRAAVLPVAAALPVWKIDASHSELTFTIRHLVSRVRGRFNVWGGTIVADPANWSTATVEVIAQAGSVDTNNERRDADLRSPDHFDADANPAVTFRSTRVARLPGDSVELYGTLTIRGVTKPVVLRGRSHGMMGAPGKRRAGFEATTVINRKDFGMLWNRAVEGGALLGDDVRIDIDIAAVEQAAK